jgi:hypothetical protein
MRRTKQIAIGLSLALVTAACSTTPASNGGTASSVSNSNQDGPVTQAGPAGAGSGQRSTSASYSRAFANCVRAHGLPDFPAPGASITSLGAYLGMARFQADVNGPCRSLAPGAWVAAGQVGQNP